LGRKERKRAHQISKEKFNKENILETLKGIVTQSLFIAVGSRGRFGMPSRKRLHKELREDENSVTRKIEGNLFLGTCTE